MDDVVIVHCDTHRLSRAPDGSAGARASDTDALELQPTSGGPELKPCRLPK